MEYHEKKYIIDSLNHNFNYVLENSNKIIYDKEGNEIDASELLLYLNKEHDLELENGLKIVFRWFEGDLHADYMETFESNKSLFNE